MVTRDLSSVATGPIIVVGGGSRNTIRGRLIEQGLPVVVSSAEQPGHASGGLTAKHALVTRGPQVGNIYCEDGNFAIVERIIEPDSGRVVICCLGVRADSSWLATEWLARHWRRLAATAGGESVSVLLLFPKPTSGDPYLSNYVEPQEIYSTTRS